MRLYQITSIVLALSPIAIAGGVPQFFPLTRKGEIPTIQPYSIGQDVLIDCISRNIDDGEHNFDSNDRIVYKAFPTCQETGKPLTFKYGVSEDVNCTIKFTDELYHLFQLYVHEDAPFSCRLPVSSEANYLELGGAFVPLTFNFRGEVHNSHLDIDPNMNMIITRPASSKPEQQTVVNAIAWSAGTNATRLTIGETLTLELAVRWFDAIRPTGSAGTAELPFADGFYKLPMYSIPVSYKQYAISLILVAVLSAVVSGLVSFRLKKPQGYLALDRESGLAKQD
ncbi:hypothetical protein METSCH_F01010 [Metschnikowia aff. pulcherrima]|uniref:Uncharacterized protein n=1 Tax=Metschnikowia aff. pulcherrima TaxID=2163413 RepID=A0A4P6XSN3_9ASCO|nr:hypothetical protein METSCH_F01010 [Metschnikowia aff. pulcherrima]